MIVVAVALMIEALVVDTLLEIEVEYLGQATGSELVVFVQKSYFWPAWCVSVVEVAVAVAEAAVAEDVAAAVVVAVDGCT